MTYHTYTNVAAAVAAAGKYPSMPELLEGFSVEDLPADVVKQVCAEVDQEVATDTTDEDKEPERKQMTVSEHPPCTDNQWERASKKKNSITLRCRVCHRYWKTRLEFFSKCTAFYAGHCALGKSCPHPHIFSKACEKHHVLQRELQRQQAESARPYVSLQQQYTAYYVQRPQPPQHPPTAHHRQSVMTLFPHGGKGLTPVTTAGQTCYQ